MRMTELNTIEVGDCREVMRRWAAEGVKVQTCVTSPPYWKLRDYEVEGQLGQEPTLAEYVGNLVEVFRCVRDVLSDDGTVWLNLGDSYTSGGNTGGGAFMKEREAGAWKGRKGKNGWRSPPSGMKQKNIIGVPWRVAFALQDDNWYLRQEIIWHKPNPMPESVTDRCTKSHEYIFLLSKRSKYFFDNEAIKEPAKYPGDTRHLRRDSKKEHEPLSLDNGSRQRTGSPTSAKINKRSVWTVPTSPYKGSHYATFPSDLIEPCILAGSRKGDTVLDPFMGRGTSAMVAKRCGREYLGCDLDERNTPLQEESVRLQQLRLESFYPSGSRPVSTQAQCEDGQSTDIRDESNACAYPINEQ